MSSRRLHDPLCPAEEDEVVRQVDLSSFLGTGAHRLTLTDRNGAGVGYQFALSYYVPSDETIETEEPLSIDLTYDRTDLAVGDSVTATATVINHMPSPAPMVILDLPIPAGFTIDRAALDRLVNDGTIVKFQMNPRSAVVYLRRMQPGQPLILRYGLTATMPVKITVPPAQAYEYYDPDRKGTSRPATLRAM